MLTQDQINSPDDSLFAVVNKPIQTMDPAGGNGWGCIPAVGLIKMLRKLAEEQGKTVEIREVNTRRGAGKVLAILALLLTAAIFSIGAILSMVRP